MFDFFFLNKYSVENMFYDFNLIYKYIWPHTRDTICKNLKQQDALRHPKIISSCQFS